MKKSGVRKKFKFDVKEILLIILAVVVVILIFAFFDYLMHQLSDKYAVPSYYFRHKIIYGTIIGAIAYYFLRNKRLLTKSLMFSAIVSILLQINYYLQGYALSFVILFLFIHFVILVLTSLFIFYLLDNYIFKKVKK